MYSRLTAYRQPAVVVCAIFLLGPVTARSATDPVSEPAHRGSPAPRFALSVEFGPAGFTKNDVRIPGDDGTKFDMLDLTGKGPDAYVRLQGDWRLNDRQSLRLVLAPLEVDGTGRLDRETEFAGSTFPAGRTRGTYNFSTYRLSWRYRLRDRGNWVWHVGVTGLIRDADVTLEQPGLKDNNDDIGFVPLLHLSGQWAFAPRWALDLEFDGLAGGPGRAFDVAAKVHYDVSSRWRLGAGYRTLEGGADTDDVYNFAWIHYGVLAIEHRF